MCLPVLSYNTRKRTPLVVVASSAFFIAVFLTLYLCLFSTEPRPTLFLFSFRSHLWHRSLSLFFLASSRSPIFCPIFLFLFSKYVCFSFHVSLLNSQPLLYASSQSWKRHRTPHTQIRLLSLFNKTRQDLPPFLSFFLCRGKLFVWSIAGIFPRFNAV